MSRYLLIGISIGWFYCCQAVLPVKQKCQTVQTARAGSPCLKWIEPGILSLSFTCPASLENLMADEMLYISPVLIRPDGRQIFFSPVIYLKKSTRRFLERRLQYQPDGFLQRAHLREPQKEYTPSTYCYQDTLAAGAGQGGLLEIRYYYANCCDEYHLSSDTLRVPYPQKQFNTWEEQQP